MLRNCAKRNGKRVHEEMLNCWKQFWFRSYLPLGDRGNCKESAACPITKASNCSHFHISLLFCSLLSQQSSMSYFFLSFICFLFFRETEAIIRKVPLVWSPKIKFKFKFKASNSSHFHIPLIFLSSTFPATKYELFFSLFDTFSLLPRDRGNYKESAPCPITKASDSSHFHILLTFVFSTFPAMQYLRFVFLSDTFSHLRNFT